MLLLCRARQAHRNYSAPTVSIYRYYAELNGRFRTGLR